MKTIDIRTSQNVTIEYELAGLRDRILAFFIDFLIVFVATMIFLFIFASGFLDAFESVANYGLIGVIIYSTFIFYQIISDVAADGQSWGKKAVGIKVVRLDGQEPGLSEYLLRAVFHVIDSFFSFGAIGALLISSSERGQRLGDMTANTTVIKVRFSLRFRLEDILKINSIEDYIPSYPEVRKLSEKDMLLIKSIITRNRIYQNAAHREVINDLVAHLQEELNIERISGSKVEFLKTLIRDYIVLTR